MNASYFFNKVYRFRYLLSIVPELSYYKSIKEGALHMITFLSV